MGEGWCDFTPNELVFAFGFLRLCQFWWKSIKKCEHESTCRRTYGQRQTGFTICPMLYVIAMGQIMSAILIFGALESGNGSHRFTCNASVCPRMESAIMSLLPSRSASPHFGRYSFPVPQRVGGWVERAGWLHTEFVCPPSNNNVTAQRPGIKLTTVESQVRRPNH